MFLNWELKHPRATLDMLGYIPGFLSLDDPRPARAQIHTAYISGWIPSRLEFKILKNKNLHYPGDPEIRLIAEAKFRNETLRFYEHEWFMIIQEDGSWEISRLD